MGVRTLFLSMFCVPAFVEAGCRVEGRLSRQTSPPASAGSASAGLNVTAYIINLGLIRGPSADQLALHTHAATMQAVIITARNCKPHCRGANQAAREIKLLQHHKVA
jgi:hypothetical protein